MRNIVLLGLWAGFAAVMTGCAGRIRPSPPLEETHEHRVRIATVESVRAVAPRQTGVSANATNLSVLGRMPSASAGVGVGEAPIPEASRGGDTGRMAKPEARSGSEGAPQRSQTSPSGARAPGPQDVEVTVRLENGELRAVVQDAGEKLAPGDRVKLVYEHGQARVTR